MNFAAMPGRCPEYRMTGKKDCHTNRHRGFEFWWTMVANNEHIRMTIRAAAKAVHRDREKVRRMVEEGKLRGFKVGGTEKNPWLEVYLDELKRAIDDDEIFTPPPLRSATGKKAARVRVSDNQSISDRMSKLHPIFSRTLARGARHD